VATSGESNRNNLISEVYRFSQLLRIGQPGAEIGVLWDKPTTTIIDTS